MISEDVIRDLIYAAERNRDCLAGLRQLPTPVSDDITWEMGELAERENGYTALAEVARLLAADERFRDALGEARDRQADPQKQLAAMADIEDEAQPIAVTPTHYMTDSLLPLCDANGPFRATAVPGHVTCLDCLAQMSTAAGEAEPADGEQGTCVHCGQPMRYVDCPTGGWWSHVVHPADDHDAEITREQP